MKQASDFLDETHVLAELLFSLSGDDSFRTTAFKSWTINDIICHLHVWNHAALLQLTDEAGLKSLLREAATATRAGVMREFERSLSEGLSGRPLFDAWLERSKEVAARFSDVDPARRLIWGGPPMSARTSMSSRFMETWAHAQAIYDELGADRPLSDRIENIVVLGLNTYEFSFRNRGLEPPSPRPRVSLTAPSGARWDFGETSVGSCVSGEAFEFCQVVTQCRSVADTRLSVSGGDAKLWMSIAQCFAGPPNDPPVPGTRKQKGCRSPERRLSASEQGTMQDEGPF